ncbi:NAD(P)-binding protein [Piedraia hortae CBS 480.64]|uniref:NAD(P)-binding protein n=1 Tax=Piedraia hortae CBS 480.64 TaxID=1314780 RepID=A0A6A7C5Z2_9PEZI|nr:NAD(P)-binding protein [Piedraia hortae CBS 480.64]
MIPSNRKHQTFFQVNGIVAVITGGRSGLSLYATRALDANGAKAVYIIGRREETLKEGAATGPCKAKGEKPSINDFQDALWQMPAKRVSSIFELNSTATYFTGVASLFPCKLAQESQIIINSSGLTFSREPTLSFLFTMSKVGLNHLVKMLSIALATYDHHIRCNAMAPGLYPNHMSKYTGPPSQDDAFADAYATQSGKFNPSKRMGSERNFAGVFLFMASQAGSYMNGQIITPDGGSLTQIPATY